MLRPMGAQCLAEYGYHRFSNWNRRHARSAARFFTLGNVFCQSGCRLRPRFTESFSWPERGGLKADRPVSDAAVKLPFGPLISLFTAVRSQTVPTRSNRFGNWKPILRSRAKNRTCSSPYCASNACEGCGPAANQELPESVWRTDGLTGQKKDKDS